MLKKSKVWYSKPIFLKTWIQLLRAAPRPDGTLALNNEIPEFLKKLEQKLAALESENIPFAKSLSARMINLKVDLR